MKTFDFKEALAFMECGFMVIGPGGRGYKIENNQLICFPFPEARPKQWRVEYKLTLEALFYNGWYLV